MTDASRGGAPAATEAVREGSAPEEAKGRQVTGDEADADFDCLPVKKEEVWPWRSGCAALEKRPQKDKRQEDARSSKIKGNLDEKRALKHTLKVIPRDSFKVLMTSQEEVVV